MNFKHMEFAHNHLKRDITPEQVATKVPASWRGFRGFLLVFILIISNQSMYSQIIFENTDTLINYLEGEWEWVSSCGGHTKNCKYPEDVGYTEKLVFIKLEDVHDSMEFIHYRADTVIAHYGTKIEGEQFLGWNLTQMVNRRLEAESDIRLILNDPGADGLTYTYERIVYNNIDDEHHFNSMLRVFANPCTKSLKININNLDIIDYVYLYNAGGSVILSYENYNTNDFMDVSGIPKGLYFVRIVAGDVEIVEKFIKE